MGGHWKIKRHLRPRIRVELGPRALKDIRDARYRSENREAITLCRQLGVPVSEARALLALQKAPEGLNHDARSTRS